MIPSTLRRFLWFSLLASAATSHAQLAITGLTDRTTPPYGNTVTFTVGTQAGYTYGVFLNKKRTPTDVPITLNEPDYYELYALRYQPGQRRRHNAVEAVHRPGNKSHQHRVGIASAHSFPGHPVSNR